MNKSSRVILKTFLGKTFSEEDAGTVDDYWKLIGLKGIVIDTGGKDGRVLVDFEIDLDRYHVANHNPIKNTLWILESDLEEIY